MRRLIFAVLLLCGLGGSARAQHVTRQGNTFTQVSSRRPQAQRKETKTEYTYKDSKGNLYPVYLSATGKAYIKRISSKTGKEYKQYLPEVGRQINPEAYKDSINNK